MSLTNFPSFDRNVAQAAAPIALLTTVGALAAKRAIDQRKIAKALAQPTRTQRVLSAINPINWIRAIVKAVVNAVSVVIAYVQKRMKPKEHKETIMQRAQRQVSSAVNAVKQGFFSRLSAIRNKFAVAGNAVRANVEGAANGTQAVAGYAASNVQALAQSFVKNITDARAVIRDDPSIGRALLFGGAIGFTTTTTILAACYKREAIKDAALAAAEAVQTKVASFRHN